MLDDILSQETEEFLKKAVLNGIIDMNDVQKKVKMKERNEILKAHEYKIWQGQDGNWRTYLKDLSTKSGRRLVKRVSEERIEDAIIEDYKERTGQKDKMTLEKLYPEWLQYKNLHTTKTSYIKRITQEWKKYYLNDELIKKPLEELNKLMLDEWAHKIVKENKLTKTQYYNMSIILRQGLVYATERNYINKNPFENVKVDRKMFRKTPKKQDDTQVFLVDEQPKIIEEAWKEFYKSQTITPLVVILAFYLGVRAGELVAIKDTDIEENYIHIQRMEVGIFEIYDGVNLKRTDREVVEHTKSSAGDRRIYIVAEARKIINLIQKINEEKGYFDNHYLFLKDGKRIYESMVAWQLEKCCKHAGVSPKSMHKIRKTYISNLISKGIHINEVRKLAGHENEKTTYGSYCYNIYSNRQTEKQLETALA